MLEKVKNSCKMGSCSCKGKSPQIVARFTSQEVRDILTKNLPGIENVVVSDGFLGAYALEDLKGFLKKDNIDEYKYVKEGFDCDDFAKVLLGREKEWYRFNTQEVGSTFGIVFGDIRGSETDTQQRAHAVNVFIDQDGQMWLVEPQNDSIFKPTSNSTFWFAFI